MAHIVQVEVLETLDKLAEVKSCLFFGKLTGVEQVIKQFAPCAILQNDSHCVVSLPVLFHVEISLEDLYEIN